MSDSALSNDSIGKPEPSVDRPAERLRGRRIVITGAGSGIGARTARLFAEEGASLVLLDQDSEGLAATAAATGGHPFQVDVTEEQSVCEAIDRGGELMTGIDGLVNAAGIMPRGPVSDVPLETWRRVLEVNLTGYYTLIRCCLPWMQRASGGTIVNIASAQGLRPTAGHTAYAASKGGVIALSRSLAAELAPHIRVNSLCPGMVDTPMADGARSFTANYALQRMADPLEIAQAILFLTSSDSSYVTGAALAVDGGRSFH